MKARPLVVCVLGAILASCGTSTRTITRTSGTITPTGTTLSGTTTTTTRTPIAAAPVYFQGVVGPAAQKPAALQLTGDGTLEVSGVQWTTWGGTDATGTGNAVYHGCNPNCAQAQVHNAVVSVRLSDVRVCRGRRYYSGISLALSSGALLDEHFLQRSWSPC